MTKQDLLAKKVFYEAKRAEIAVNDNAEEIEAKITAYRAQLEAEYNAEKQKDLTKLDSYLELLDELINESFVEAEAIQSTNDTIV